MSSALPSRSRAGSATLPGSSPAGGGDGAANLADVLERVLDKGIVIVGDIRIDLLDIELLTIRLRLVVAGVDTARRIGLDWWENDPWFGGAEAAGERSLDERLSRIERQLGSGDARDGHELEAENEALRGEVERLRRELTGGTGGTGETGGPRETGATPETGGARAARETPAPENGDG